MVIEISNGKNASILTLAVLLAACGSKDDALPPTQNASLDQDEAPMAAAAGSPATKYRWIYRQGRPSRFIGD